MNPSSSPRFTTHVPLVYVSVMVAEFRVGAPRRLRAPRAVRRTGSAAGARMRDPTDHFERRREVVQAIATGKEHDDGQAGGHGVRLAGWRVRGSGRRRWLRARRLALR